MEPAPLTEGDYTALLAVLHVRNTRSPTPILVGLAERLQALRDDLQARTPDPASTGEEH